MRYYFEDCVLDTGQRELRRKSSLISVEPQIFDLLVHLMRHRERVVTKDDLLAALWRGRIVSESTLANRINAARSAIGDTGNEQRADVVDCHAVQQQVHDREQKDLLAAAFAKLD